MRSSRIALCCVVALWALLGSLAVSAEVVLYSGDGDLPMEADLPVDSAGVITVGSVPVLVIPGNGGGFTVGMRAQIVDCRMTEILSAGLTGPVTVKALRGKPTLYVGEFRLITVYPEDTVGTGLCMWQLARKWAAQVASALAVVSPGSDYTAGECTLEPAVAAEPLLDEVPEDLDEPGK